MLQHNGDLSRITAPAVEPVTLEEMQSHLSGFNPADNADIESLITVAREKFEADTGLVLIDQTWRLTIPFFAPRIELYKPPLRSIEQVQYYDASNTLQTLDPADYRTEKRNQRTRLAPAISQHFPEVEYERTDAVIIDFKAGIYGTSGSPTAVDLSSGAGFEHRYPLAQRAIKVLVDHFYRNRGAVAPVALHQVPMAYKSLVDFCKVEWF